MPRLRRPSPAPVVAVIVLINGMSGAAVAQRLIAREHKAQTFIEHRSVIGNAPLGERNH
jgi:hypothetical protein